GARAIGGVQADLALIGADDPGQAVQEGRLARSGGPHDGQGFAVADVEVHTGQGVGLAVVFGEVPGGDDCGALRSRHVSIVAQTVARHHGVIRWWVSGQPDIGPRFLLSVPQESNPAYAQEPATRSPHSSRSQYESTVDQHSRR